MALLGLGVRLCAWALVLAAPLPLSWAVVQRVGSEPGAPSPPRSHAWLTVLLLWTLSQSALVLLLLAAQRYTAGWVLGTEALVGAGGLLLLRRTPRPRGELTAPAAPWSVGELLLLGAHGVLLLALLYLCTTRPITDYDSLAYHLPIVVEWLQRGGYAVPTPFGGLQGTFYPYTWEALCGLGLLLVQGDDGALWPNLVCWVLLALSVYRLGRLLGASRTGGLGASLLLVSQPLVIEQVTGLHIDLPFAAFFLAALSYVLRDPAPGERGDGLWGLAALALLCTTKLSALGYVALLLVVGLGRRLLTPRPAARPLPRRALLVYACVAACSLWVGLFWYALNAARSGNPLGLVPVALGGHLLLPGDVAFMAYVKKTSLLSLFKPSNPEHLKTLVKVLAFHLELPFLALSGLALLSVRRWGRRGGALAALLVACIGLYVATPYSGDNGLHNFQITTWIGQGLRYALPALGLLAALAAPGFDRLVRAPRLVTLLALAPIALALGRVRVLDHLAAAGVLIDTPSGQRALATTIAAALGAAVLLSWLLPAALRTLTRRAPAFTELPQAARVAVVAVLLVAGALGLGLLSHARAERRRLAYGPTVEALDRLPPDWPAAYVSGTLSYPLFGSNHRRPLRLVPPPPESADPARWVDQARRAGIRILIFDPHPTPSEQPLWRWLSSSPNYAHPLTSAPPDQDRTAFLLPPPA